MNFNLLFINLFSISIILIAIPVEVITINCYQCDSKSDIDCSEKFDPNYTKLKPESCEHVYESRYCVKTTGIFEGKIGTQRLCSSRDYGDFCDYVRRPGDERDYRSCVFTCSSDACNHSSALYVSQISFISLIFFTFIYFFTFS